MEIWDVNVINALLALRRILDTEPFKSFFKTHEYVATQKVMGGFLIPDPIAKWLESDSFLINEPIPSEAFKNLRTSDRLGFRVSIYYEYIFTDDEEEDDDDFTTDGALSFKGIYFRPGRKYEEWRYVNILEKYFVVEVNLDALVTKNLLDHIKAQYLSVVKKLTKNKAVHPHIEHPSYNYVILKKYKRGIIRKNTDVLTEVEWAHILLPVTIYNFVKVILDGALIGKTTDPLIHSEEMCFDWVIKNPVFKDVIIDLKSKLLEFGNDVMEIIQVLASG
jgi:hypothetical protein